MKYVETISLIVALASCVGANLNTNRDGCGPRKFKLPEGIKPSHYKIMINPNADLMTFTGTVDIHLNVDRPKQTGLFSSIAIRNDKTAKQIVLNADPDFVMIDEKSITYTDKYGIMVKVTGLCYDSEFGNVVVSLKKDLTPGSSGALHMEFKGKINNQFEGLFKDEIYHGDGTKSHVLMTQFQSSYARKFFPCFDEPNFKATFEMTVVHPVEHIALSNTMVVSSQVDPLNSGKVITKFEKTPLMSTYLVAIAIGNFDYLEAESPDGKVTMRIYTPPGRSAEARDSLSIAVRAMGVLQDYFEVDYPLKKLDFVSCANFKWGGMENYGLILIQDPYIMSTKDSPLMYKETTALTIVHEIVHQWIGNLVTLKWWDETWLNEGLTTDFEYMITHELYPELEVQVDERVGFNAMIMELDDKRVRPAKIFSVYDVEDTFDNVSYRKGAAVARMLREYVGQDNYKAAIRDYLRANSFGNVQVTDLSSIMAKHSGKSVSEFLKTWLDNKGHPMLSVDYDPVMNRLSIYQHKYLSPSLYTDLWVVPVRALISNGQGEKAILKFTISGRNEMLDLPKWFDGTKPGAFIKVNHLLPGFYHVKHSPELLDKLVEAMKMKKLSLFDRMDLLRTHYQLFKMSSLPSDDLMKIFDGLADENDPAMIDLMLDYSMSNKDRRSAVSLAHRFSDTIGFNEVPDYKVFHKIAHDHLMERLVIAGFEPAVKSALALFDNSQRLDEITVSFRGTIYLAVAKYGSDKQFARLLEYAANTQSSNEKMRAYEALSGAPKARLDEVYVTLVSDRYEFLNKKERLSRIMDSILL